MEIHVPHMDSLQSTQISQEEMMRHFSEVLKSSPLSITNNKRKCSENSSKVKGSLSSPEVLIWSQEEVEACIMQAPVMSFRSCELRVLATFFFTN